jgi:adenylate cyclase
VSEEAFAESDQRAELVDWLLAEGFTAEQINDSFAPMLLPARRALGDDGTLLSARQISEQTGMDVDCLLRILHAAGRPRVDDLDTALYLPVDATLIGYAQQCLDLGFPEDQVVAVVQVMTEGLTRTVEVMRYAALSAVVQPGATELAAAKASGAITAQVAPLLGPLIQEMLRTQLLHAMLDEEVSATERLAGRPLPGSGQVSIAFADLVGFTSLGEELPPEDLERLSQRLTDLARELAEPPVRFVKTIGDEVMLVSSEPVPLLQMVLDLVDAADADEALPRLKAGMATGVAVSRAGDWFGSPVNQASRVTGVARPGAVLLAESAREALGDAEGFTWSFAGARRLKGIRDEVKLFRARRTVS